MKPSLRWLVAVIAVFALIGGACGGDDDDGGGSSDTADGAESSGVDDQAAEDASDADAAADADGAGDDTDGGDTGVDDTDAADAESAGDDTEEAVALTASFRGVTEDTITLGFSMLDFDLLQELNLSPNGWGDQQLVYQTFVDDINANGGINGRMIEPVYRFYSPLGTTEAEAACLELTQDNETFAVLGGFLGPSEAANTCITGVQNTILIGGQQTAERLAEAQAPWLQTGGSRGRRLEVLLTLLEDEGMLEGRSVALVGGIDAQDDFDRAKELMPEFGIPPVVEILMEAADGDIPAVDAAWGSFSEALRVSGADTALIVGSTSGNIRGIRNNGLDIDLWAVDNDRLENLGESVDPAWADGTVTLQSMGDIEAWDDETVAECRRIFDEANPDAPVIAPADAVEGDEQWFNPIMAYCRWLQAFVLIATAAGPDLTHDSFNEAAYGLGDFSLPAQPYNSFGPDKPDANDSYRLAEYDASIGARGEAVPMTDIVDVTP